MSQSLLDSHPSNNATSLPRCASRPSSPRRVIQHSHHHNPHTLPRASTSSTSSVPAATSTSVLSTLSHSPTPAALTATQRPPPQLDHHRRTVPPSSLARASLSTSRVPVHAPDSHSSTPSHSTSIGLESTAPPPLAPSPASAAPSSPGQTLPAKVSASPAQAAHPPLPSPKALQHSEEAQHQQDHLTQQAQLQRQHRDEAVREVLCAAKAFGRQDWVDLMQLSCLASQHHLSPYSVVKYGIHGSPFAYVPLSLQQPELVEETLVKQREHECKAVAWLQLKRAALGAVDGRHGERRAMNHPESASTFACSTEVASLDHRSELINVQGNKRPASSAAVTRRATSAARIDIDSQAAGSIHTWTHASDGSSTRDGMDWKPTSPTLPSKTSPLSSLSSSSSSSNPIRTHESTITLPVSSPLRAGTAHADRKNHSEAELAAMSFLEVLQSKARAQYEQEQYEKETLAKQESIARDADRVETVSAPPSSPNGVSATKYNSLLYGPAQQQSLAIKTSDTHPINISVIVPPELLATISYHIWTKECTLRPPTLRDALRKTFALSQPSVPLPSLRPNHEHENRQVRGEALIRVGSTIDLSSTLPQMLPASDIVCKVDDEVPSQVGNLYMSSCPGKKVRLSGPVRGRGAICRDLGLDLSRIAALGVGAVVCCLDDEELGFLGAPWSEYEKQADALGMHVVRLPMAEGYAPTCVETIDATVSALVTDYTLRGRHLLVHCRGGVGRAGLIACAWMLKLGLVQPSCDPAIPSARIPEGSPTSPRILDLVARLIDTIRRRRSPKAIETAEQVRFVVEYATHIDRQEQLCAAHSGLT